MAEAISTADSAARLDPILLIVMPACPQGHGAVAHVRARPTAYQPAIGIRARRPAC